MDRIIQLLCLLIPGVAGLFQMWKHWENRLAVLGAQCSRVEIPERFRKIQPRDERVELCPRIHHVRTPAPANFNVFYSIQAGECLRNFSWKPLWRSQRFVRPYVVAWPWMLSSKNTTTLLSSLVCSSGYQWLPRSPDRENAAGKFELEKGIFCKKESGINGGEKNPNKSKVCENRETRPDNYFSEFQSRL